MNLLPLALAALLFAVTSAASAQSSQRPIQTNRTDRSGVEWAFGERNDTMDDRREIAAVARWRRTVIGLFCLAEDGAEMRFKAPGWFFPPGREDHVQVRIDRQDAVDVAVLGSSADGSFAIVRPNRAGRDLVRAFVAGRERIAIRNRHGETVTMPLSAPKPELDRFMRRCQEIAPTIAEAD